MDKDEIRKRAVELYADELQYSIARDEQVDLQKSRSRAAMRLSRYMDGQDISGVWLAYVEGVARQIERRFEIDLTDGQLKIGGALRVGDLVFVPADKARIQDWLALDARREDKYQEHAMKRESERSAIKDIVDRMRSFGGDPTTFEACPDLFAGDEAA